MKGVVFTTFFDHVRNEHGEDMVDDLIDEVDPPNGGAYTRVGSYPFDEMVSFVSALSQRTGEGLPIILERLGAFCFASWVETVPEHFSTSSDLFDVLANIDQFHETEVKKIYPEAELPSFRPTHRDERLLELDYVSCKPLADLAVGVIRGAARHFGEDVEVAHELRQREGGKHIAISVRRR